MLRDLISWIIRLGFQLVFWVLILSIRIDGRTIYDRTYDILVDNELFNSVDEKVQDLWYTLSESVKKSFLQFYEEKKSHHFKGIDDKE
tara:strand:- start:300 stop:563 length:264 start_codon:yes stop_codon:yes gene_type:complete